MCWGRGGGWVGEEKERVSTLVHVHVFGISQTAKCTGMCLRAAIASFGWLKSTLAFRAISNQSCDGGRNRPRRPGPPRRLPSQRRPTEKREKKGGETHTGGWRRAKQQNHHHTPVPAPPRLSSLLLGKLN